MFDRWVKKVKNFDQISFAFNWVCGRAFLRGHINEYCKIFSSFFLALSFNAQAGTPQFSHVVTVIFENANYADVLKQPFFSDVAKKGALFTNFIAEGHPSQPNYIAYVAGDTLGVRSDSNVNLNSSHVGNLFEQKGLDWKVYAENLPSPCFLGASQGRYARKHVPFISFRNVQSNVSECAKIVNASLFDHDIQSGNLPAYSLYIPNLDNDGHDTGAAYAGKWLENTFGPYFRDANITKDTLFILTFDESESYIGKNQIYNVFVGANVIPASSVSAETSHYSVLKLIEETFRLGTLNRKDSSAGEITGIWK